MPALTIKNSDVSGTGDVTSADKVMENLYEPDATTPDTLEIINGWLDRDNLDGTDPIDEDAIQPGTFVRYGQRGSNVAFDVFDDLFPRVNYDPDDTTDDKTNMIPVPGAQIRFYLPYAPAAVLFQWMLNWTTDLAFLDVPTHTYCAPAHFAVDGKSTITQPHSQRRVAVATVQERFFDPSLSGTVSVHLRYSQADQKWAGHRYVTGLTAGWHTAGLYIGMSDAYSYGGHPTQPDLPDIAQQARVRSRSIRYIAFR